LERLVFKEIKKPAAEKPEKNFSEQRSSNKLNPHMTPGPGIGPRTHAHWWEASGLTTAQSLNQKKYSN